MACRKKMEGSFFLWIVIGELITVTFEKYAVATGRWAYAQNMPLLFGIGVTPIFQWIVAPGFLFLIFRFKLKKI